MAMTGQRDDQRRHEWTGVDPGRVAVGARPDAAVIGCAAAAGAGEACRQRNTSHALQPRTVVSHVAAAVVRHALHLLVTRYAPPTYFNERCFSITEEQKEKRKRKKMNWYGAL